MKGKGFTHLNEDELTILRAFSLHSEIAFPVDCGFSREYTLKLLQALKTKDIVTGQAPYRLTKKGRKVKQEMTDE
jgi:uncharacterized protein YjhX (UPF0386 family)